MRDLHHGSPAVSPKERVCRAQGVSLLLPVAILHAGELTELSAAIFVSFTYILFMQLCVQTQFLVTSRWLEEGNLVASKKL